MALVNQGRGKSAFREFKRDLRRATNDILASAKGGFSFTQLDIQNIYDLVLINYVRDIVDADLPNPATWITRGERATSDAEEKTLRKLSIESVNLFETLSEIEEGSGTDEGLEISDSSILGYPRINPENRPRLGRLGLQRRNQVILPGDLEEYVTHVPYIIGIEPVFEDGQLKGFKLWVQN